MLRIGNSKSIQRRFAVRVGIIGESRMRRIITT
jgi:hypothetical protein